MLFADTSGIDFGMHTFAQPPPQAGGQRQRGGEHKGLQRLCCTAILLPASAAHRWRCISLRRARRGWTIVVRAAAGPRFLCFLCILIAAAVRLAVRVSCITVRACWTAVCWCFGRLAAAAAFIAAATTLTVGHDILYDVAQLL